MRPHRFGTRPTALLGIAVAASGALAVATLQFAPPSSAGTLSGNLYKESSTKVATWLAANPSDSRASVISSKIASQPTAHWLSSYSPSTVQSEVSTLTTAANAAGQIPVIAVYEIPNRDCGGASAGGAPDLTSYATWVSNFSKGLGSKTVIVVLEPDSLALQTCLSASDVTARDNALAAAVTTIKAADPAAKVYLDAGHAGWNSASDQAARLKAAGVTSADGFFSNASNYYTTADETSYGQAILSALGNPSNLHQVIDTSRNGAGPGSGDWCDDNLPSTRRLGTNPTLSTGVSTVDGYLWIKPPGELDGCSGTAGAFSAANAYSLAGGGTATTTTTTSTTTTTTKPSTTTTTTTTSKASTTTTTTKASTTTTTSKASTTTTTTKASTTTTASGSLACSVAYVPSSWTGGFSSNITIKNTGSTTINGWTLTFTFPGDQKITSAWNGTYTQTGTSVSIVSTSSNATIAAGSSAAPGIQGTWTTSNTSPTAFALNGKACTIG